MNLGRSPGLMQSILSAPLRFCVFFLLPARKLIDNTFHSRAPASSRHDTVCLSVMCRGVFVAP